MPDLPNLLAVAAVSPGMVLTPGPNMVCLESRSISQGRRAGLCSLAGVALGLAFYALCAAFGITALLTTVPVAYDALHFAGAAYLLYVAWQAHEAFGVRPSRSGRCRATAGKGLSSWDSSPTC